MQFPVQPLKLVRRHRILIALQPGEHLLVPVDPFLAPLWRQILHCDGYSRHLHQQTQLVGIANKPDIEARHHQTPLRKCRQKPLRLQTRDGLANRTERKAGRIDQFALRDDLPRLEAPLVQQLLDSGIGRLAQHDLACPR